MFFIYFILFIFIFLSLFITYVNVKISKNDLNYNENDNKNIMHLFLNSSLFIILGSGFLILCFFKYLFTSNK
jgi:hypothetical protein